MRWSMHCLPQKQLSEILAMAKRKKHQHYRKLRDNQVEEFSLEVDVIT
ncbi:hypothetical protein TcasGA2_TC032868 [Tribolium castaneum]|uniref:Uncharacterized protein n=1 Tax=Tribolium castaneum TaxID=7070 RepID=A0A139WJF7_TRICA|nr:hypothetical protein TcasGA2_TC032868 [Tribolium castaneum]